MGNELQKKLAAERAVEEIQSGMVVGLGTGSTFKFALDRIGEKVNSGELKEIVCVSSSIRTEHIALRLGIPLISLNDLYISGEEQKVKNEELRMIDITIDGADEVDQHLNLIKGGGGALLREKIIVQSSKKFLVIVDESKISNILGTNFALPIEVIPMALNSEKKFIESLGANVSIRKTLEGENYFTDEKNFILDAKFDSIPDVKNIAMSLNERAGIVEHGLFPSNLVAKVFCAGNNGVKEFIH